MTAAVHRLPGTVAEALEWAAEQNGQSVVVLVQGTDDTWEASWSLMTMDRLVYAHRVLGIAIDARINGEVPTR